MFVLHFFCADFGTHYDVFSWMTSLFQSSQSSVSIGSRTAPHRYVKLKNKILHSQHLCFFKLWAAFCGLLKEQPAQAALRFLRQTLKWLPNNTSSWYGYKTVWFSESIISIKGFFFVINIWFTNLFLTFFPEFDVKTLYNHKMTTSSQITSSCWYIFSLLQKCMMCK